MIKEKSCGAVVYKVESGTIYYYIIKQVKGHFSFPKGHVEEKETEEETATREIEEETNLRVIVDSKFREVSTYSPKPGVVKDVIFFVALTINDNIKAQKEEVSDVLCLPYEEAYNALTYEKDKEILHKADIYIKKRIK
jgi:8-oxo-dGTP pyrophosphatase MutT (NUDIX family)